MNADEAEAAEGIVILNMIYLVKNGPQYPEKVPKTSHCLAMLYFLCEDGVKVCSAVLNYIPQTDAARPVTKDLPSYSCCLIKKWRLC